MKDQSASEGGGGRRGEAGHQSPVGRLLLSVASTIPGEASCFLESLQYISGWLDQYICLVVG